MKKILLFFMAVFLTTVSLQAATSYGFYVGGVSVTSSNYDNVHGGDILSGSVVYNPSTNTVTLTNVTITCSGSNDNALWNDDCSGLTVKIVGTCIFTTRHRTISLYETTYFEIGSGSVLNVNLHDPLKDNEAAIYTQALLEFYGPGTLNVSAKTDDVSSHTSAAFEGHGSNTSSKLHFSNITAYISSNCQGIFDFNTVRFYSGSDVEISNSYGWVSPIFDTENVILYSDEAIVQPADAYYDPSAFDGRGEFVNATKYIHITDNYGAILSTANFPDDNFRSCMRSLYPKQWLTKAELQNLTTLDVHGQSISNLKGVEKLTYLQKLVCYSNSISSLDLTSNTKLTYLSCYSNAMTSLLVYNCSNLTYLDCAPNNLTSLNLSKLTNLQTLYCYDNQLTNITFASSTPNLQTVSCHSNNFTTFGLVGRHALKTLNINNCTSLTTLNCYDNDLTTLNVTGNSALTRLDCRANGSLSTVTGLAGCTEMIRLSCYNCAFTDLNSVVSGMKNLEYFYCDNNKLTSLTLQNKSKLKRVDCYSNPNLTTVTITGNSALESLYSSNCQSLTTLKCYRNALTDLDVRSCTALNRLECYENDDLATITGLSDCKAITYLDCEDCKISNLSAVSDMTNIATLLARNNKLTSLSVTGKSQLSNMRVSGNTSLTTLACNRNALVGLDISDCTAMTTLECYENAGLSSITGLTGCTALTYLDCDDCNFSSLNVSPLTKLTGLRCCNNQLTSLNVLALTSLQYLHCNGNKLTSLNVSSKTSLKELYCYNNQLTSLNVQGCSALTNIECDGNKLTSLYLQGCSSLKTLYCYCNQITGSGMTTLVSSLPTCSSSNPGNLYAIFDNAEGNTMTTAQITTALNKYWNPKRFNGIRWEDMTTGGLKGDVNNSGTVDISDVIDIINYVLTGNGTGLNLSVADVNEDNLVDVNDVTNVINYVLNGVW